MKYQLLFIVLVLFSLCILFGLQRCLFVLLVSACRSVYLAYVCDFSVCLPFCLSVCLSLCISLCLICLPVRLSFCLPLFLCLFLLSLFYARMPVCWCVCVSLSLGLAASLPLHLPLLVHPLAVDTLHLIWSVSSVVHGRAAEAVPQSGNLRPRATRAGSTGARKILPPRRSRRDEAPTDAPNDCALRGRGGKHPCLRHAGDNE